MPEFTENVVVDGQYDPQNEPATYEFEVIDCAGNISEKSRLVVRPEEIPNHAVLGDPFVHPPMAKLR